jgi:hypothetical protein
MNTGYAYLVHSHRPVSNRKSGVKYIIPHHAGICTLAVTPYIVRRDLVAAMFQAAERAGLKHPFTRETVSLQDSDDYLVAENLPWVDYPKRDVEGRPAVDGHGNPVMVCKLFNTKYFAHIDLAKSKTPVGLLSATFREESRFFAALPRTGATRFVPRFARPYCCESWLPEMVKS